MYTYIPQEYKNGYKKRYVFSNRDYEGESISEVKLPLAAKKPRTVGVVEPRVVVKIPWTKIGGLSAKKTVANPSTSSQGTSKQMPMMMMLTPDPTNDHQQNVIRHQDLPLLAKDVCCTKFIPGSAKSKALFF